jgi:hypothetical protein
MVSDTTIGEDIMNLFRAYTAIGAIGILCQAALADPSPVIHCAGAHYAPRENLEQIDVACIDSA